MQARTANFTQNRMRAAQSAYPQELGLDRPENSEQIELSQLSLQQIYQSVCPFKVAMFIFMLLVIFYLHRIAYK